MAEQANPQKFGESRISKRIKTDIKVVFQINESMKDKVRFSKDIIPSTAIDISSGGIATSSDYFIPKGTLLDIKIEKKPFYPDASSEGDFIQATGKVMSSVMETRARYRLGIQFTNISDNDKLAIEKFVAKNEKNI